MINDIDYKTISFTRSDGVDVTYKVALNNPTDLNENFLVLKGEGISKQKEMELFYWLDNKRWTINELQYFALNNELCMKIFDKSNAELASYGVCAINNRVFGFTFGYNFN